MRRVVLGSLLTMASAFAAATVQVTVRTNLNGPLVTVDGIATFTGSQTFTWTAGSTHTLAAVNTQLFPDSQGRFVFQNWSNGGTATHVVTTPDSATTFTAQFGREFSIQFATLPTNRGSISPASGFYLEGASLNVAAHPADSFQQFLGLLSGTVNPQTLTVTQPGSVTAVFPPGVVPITIRTDVDGPQISVDGGKPYSGSQTFIWLVGSQHTLAATTPQLSPADDRSRYSFRNWSHGGALRQVYTTPDAATTITAQFNVEHRIDFTVNPFGCGTVTPSSGFYAQDATLEVVVQPNRICEFIGFSGALSGTVSPQSLTVTGPLQVTADFNAPPVSDATSGSFAVRYFSNLRLGDSLIYITNSGERGAGLLAGVSASTVGAICANVYTFSSDAQLLSCCSCPVTPNGLAALSARRDLVDLVSPAELPTSIVVKLLATVPERGTCVNSASAISEANLAPGMVAWGTTIYPPAEAGAARGVVETPFLPATLSVGPVSELSNLRQLCTRFIANGSGFNLCRSCRIGSISR